MMQMEGLHIFLQDQSVSDKFRAKQRTPCRALFCLKRAATVSVFLTVGFSHARYPNGNRTSSI